MKLSSKGCYGVKALFDMAFYHPGQAAQIKDISERQGVPPRFLEQIFQDLKRAGLVTSKRGPQGGYQLGETPAKIRIGDVLRALEGPIELQPEASEKKPGELGQQVSDLLWHELSVAIEGCCDSVTIKDLCLRADAIRARKNKNVAHMYVI